MSFSSERPSGLVSKPALRLPIKVQRSVHKGRGHILSVVVQYSVMDHIPVNNTCGSLEYIIYFLKCHPDFLLLLVKYLLLFFALIQHGMESKKLTMRTVVAQ